jgi:outer membrane immunogenic protein
MKKLVIALTAVAAFTGSAFAADLPARTYSKAPVVMAPVYNWTGFYIFGGGGYGLFATDDINVDTVTGAQLNRPQRMGGTGWYGTVGAGYDWQFNGSWVAGIFADGQFGSIKGTLQNIDDTNQGFYKVSTSVAAGVRVGYLVAPNVLSYINGGYAYSQWSGSSQDDINDGSNFGFTRSFNRNGWFLGGGVENSLNIFGLASPGWFMKTEYRVAEYQRGTVAAFNPNGTPLCFGAVCDGISTRPIVQTVSTSLVYRFNWGGPVVAKY